VSECMGYGKPVVASSLFKEIGSVDETIAYIFRKGCAPSLAETIHDVYSNYPEALRKASKALHRVKNISW